VRRLFSFNSSSSFILGFHGLSHRREVKRRKEARRKLPRPDLIANLAKEFNRLKLEAADAKAKGDNERRKNASSFIGQLRKEMESCGLTSEVDDLVDQWQAAEQPAKQGDEEKKEAQQSDSEFEAGSKDQLLSFFDVRSLALREMIFLLSQGHLKSLSTFLIARSRRTPRQG